MKYAFIPCIISALLYSQSSHANPFGDIVGGLVGEEQQSTYVSVWNNTSNTTISSVSVQHKYSNEFYEKMQFVGLFSSNYYVDHRQLESGYSNKVRYWTGPTTTGVDWWMVQWSTTDGRICKTNPQNFREVFDYADQTLAQVNSEVSDLVSRLDIPGIATTYAQDTLLNAVGVDPNSPAGMLSKKLMPSKSWVPNPASNALLALSMSTKTWSNTTSTAGFKQHMLTAQDAGSNGIKIQIYDNEVRFVSPSGTSSTNISCQSLPESKITLKHSGVQKATYTGNEVAMYISSPNGLCVSFMANGSVALLPCDGQDYQVWYLHPYLTKSTDPNNPDFAVLTNKSSGQQSCLTIPDYSTSDGTWLGMRKCEGENFGTFNPHNQHWDFIDQQANGTVTRIQNQYSAKCMTMTTDASNDVIFQKSCSAANQYFTLSPAY